MFCLCLYLKYAYYMHICQASYFCWLGFVVSFCWTCILGMLCHMYGYLVTCIGDYILLYLEHGRLYVRLLVLYWWLLYFVISWAWQIICMVTCTGDYHILLYLEHGRLHVWFLALVAIALVVSWAWLVTCMVTCTSGYCICYILSMVSYVYGYLHWWLSHLL